MCTCTVVICTRNRPTELRRCLQALSTLRSSDFEILVVDNASDDYAAMILAQEYGAGYVYDPVPGLDHARNVGARISETDIVAYLDDDAVADPDWLDALVAEFSDPQVAVVVGRCLPLKIETEAERLWAQIHGPNWGSEIHRVVSRNSPGWFTMATFGDLGIGANMAFRRAAFEVWPGFDERLDRGTPLDGNGENHAFLSLVRLGYKLVATPKATVRHPHPPTLVALRARRLKDRSGLAGYVCMLLVEESGHRLETLRFVLGKIFGKLGRRSRGTRKLSGTPLISPMRLFLAQLRGPWLYAASTWRARRKVTSTGAFVPYPTRAFTSPRAAFTSSMSRIDPAVSDPQELHKA